MDNQLIIGDCRQTLKELPGNSVHCAITSPPYWQLRDYGYADQLGMEETPQEFVQNQVGVFAEVHRVLRADGVLFVNIGDSYASSGKNRTPAQASNSSTLKGGLDTQQQVLRQRSKITGGLKAKDLVGIPWRLAFALQDFGWYLRQDIIWHKPTPMPQSVRDRCTTAHEYVFLLTKSPKYYWDWYGISTNSNRLGLAHYASGTGQRAEAMGRKPSGNERPEQKNSATSPDRANKRSVWTIASKGYSGAHFACFPPKLVEPMVLAGSPDKCCAGCGKGYVRRIETERRPTKPGDKTKVKIPTGWDTSTEEGGHGNYHKNGRRKPEETGNQNPRRHVTTYVDKGFFKACDCETDQTAPAVILDPFAGSGTTGQVAQQLGRNWILCEGNPDYAKLIQQRTKQGILF